MAQDTHERIHRRTAVLTRGFDPRLSFGSARPAVFRSSTYVFNSPEAAERAFSIAAGRIEPEDGERPDLIYSRISHPNAEILEDQIVPLEAGAGAAAVFNSGMAAIMTTFLSFLRTGDSLVYTTPLYGGTTGLIHNLLEPFGIRVVPAHSGDGDGIDAAIAATPNLKMVYLETPANPTLIMTDVRRIADAAARLSPRPLVIVDNTFMGPTFQHPLLLGADLVVYSATKYLSGFSDMVAGAVIGRDSRLLREILHRRVMFGNILQPDECWMLDGRLPTVQLRMNRQSKSAQRLAEALAGRRELARVIYPTLFTDPEQKRIYDAQCDYPGGLFSVEFRGGREAAFSFLRSLKIARNAVSLGGVETLVCHPKSTTHSGMSTQELAESGVTDGLVRFSIGIEDWRDLLADFEQAFAAIQ